MITEFDYFESNQILRSYRAAIMADPRSLQTWLAENGYRLARGIEPGMIGQGSKVHRLYVMRLIRESDSKSMVWNAHSSCGSQRWHATGGRSGLGVLHADTPITCKKCGG